MHAYAARDPVFIAMNERGQLETGGELGPFCVRCHAPMALELGLTSDGLNLPDLSDRSDPNARGVTCYFCHDIRAVLGDHNRDLLLAGDRVMRGGLGGGKRAIEARNAAPAQPNPIHASAYSALHDATQTDSAKLCGACHDVVNAQGVALERTFAEWRGSRFGHDGGDGQTCSDCHMQGYDGRAVAHAPERHLHRHLWPGVDTALESTFPGIDAQSAAIECQFADAIQLALSPSSASFDAFDVVLTNLRAGHAWPSGAVQDRRAWVELIGYDAEGGTIFQSGVVGEGQVVGAQEPSLEVLRDRLYDANGLPVHMFWQAAPSADHPSGYESNLLAAPTEDGAPASRTLHYTLPAPASRVSARLRLQTIGLDVLDDFRGLQLPISDRVINNGYLQDHTLRSRIRTITVPGTQRELRVDGSAAPDSPAPRCDLDYASLLGNE